MRYGFVIPKGDPLTVADLAREAEAVGWDGVFTWDGIHIEAMGPIYDPWGHDGRDRAPDGARQVRGHCHAAVTPSDVEGRP